MFGDPLLCGFWPEHLLDQLHRLLLRQAARPSLGVADDVPAGDVGDISEIRKTGPGEGFRAGHAHVMRGVHEPHWTAAGGRVEALGRRVLTDLVLVVARAHHPRIGGQGLGAGGHGLVERFQARGGGVRNVQLAQLLADQAQVVVRVVEPRHHVRAAEIDHHVGGAARHVLFERADVPGRAL